MSWRNYDNETKNVVWFGSKGKKKLVSEGAEFLNVVDPIILTNNIQKGQRIKVEIIGDSMPVGGYRVRLFLYDEDDNQLGVMFIGDKTCMTEFQIEGIKKIEVDESGYPTINVYIYPYYINEEKAKNFVDKQEGTASSLRQLLSVIKGEIWYSISYGLPLYEKISTKVQMDANVLTIINNHSEVRSIKKFNSTISGHAYNCDILVETIYGDLQIGI